MLAQILALVGILIGTATDIHHREVPDWVNYTMILAGLGLASAASIHEASSNPLLASGAGLAIGYLVGALMYYTGQWGGGDAKMLMGLGALLGAPISFFTGDTSAPLLIYFLITVVFAGAAYGMTWMTVLFVTQRKTVLPALKKKLREPTMLKTRKVAITALLLLVITTLVWTNIYMIAALTIAAISYLTLYASLAAKTIEETCFVKDQPVNKLVVGDWVVEAVKHNKKVLVPASNTGLTPQQLEALKKSPIKKVRIKEGIPFVPSFLIAYVAAYYWHYTQAGLLFWI